MPASSLSTKIKSILFNDRPKVMSTGYRRPEDSRTNLVTEVAGPSSDMTPLNDDVDDTNYHGILKSRSAHSNGDQGFLTRSKSERPRDTKRRYQSSSIERSRSTRGFRRIPYSTEIGASGFRPGKTIRGPRRQQLLKEHRTEHNSSQQVHVWEPESERLGQLEPAGDLIGSCSDSSLAKAKSFNSTGIEEDQDMRILLNVGGVRHETHVSTLNHIPESRLFRLAEYHLDSGKGKQEYFFDRHPAVFNSIIDFYRTGELHVPLEVCGAVVKRELDFWQIDELGTKACCWRHYRSYIENQHILDSFKHSLDRESMNADLSGLQGWKLWQTRIWYIMDHPRTSRLAMAYGITSFLFVTMSIAGFCLETLPQFRLKAVNTTITCNGDSNSTISIMVRKSHVGLHVLDFICTVFFTLELIVRFTVSPAKPKFVMNPMNVIDLLALVPLYVQVVFEQTQTQSCYMNERFVIRVMFILRIFRMFRIFHLVKHYQALKVLVYALKASLQELMMLFIFLLLAMLIFATMIYYAERGGTDDKTNLNTIPVGFWWAIITMTMVGYGDKVPKTPIGYVVGTACAVVGVLLFALTFPIIANNFTLFYTHVRSRSISPRSKSEEDSANTVKLKSDDVTIYKLGADCPPEPIDLGQGVAMRNVFPERTRGAHRIIVESDVVDPSLNTLHSSSGEEEEEEEEESSQVNRVPRNASSPARLCSSQRPTSGQFAPIARFSDASSMNDIDFHVATDDLLHMVVA